MCDGVSEDDVDVDVFGAFSRFVREIDSFDRSRGCFVLFFDVEDECEVDFIDSLCDDDDFVDVLFCGGCDGERVVEIFAFRFRVVGFVDF